MDAMMTEPPKPTKYYYGIDLIKFICSLLIAAIHIYPLKSINSVLDYYLRVYLARLAVPFYFTASGFLLFRKTDPNHFSPEPSLLYIKKTLRLYGTWLLILFISTSTGPLWYLRAVVIAVALISFFLYKKIPLKYIFILSGLLYIIGLLGDSYYGLLRPLDNIGVFHTLFTVYDFFFFTTRNGLFMGSLFVSMGMLFACKPIRIPWKYAIAGFIASMLLLLGEVIVLKRYIVPKDNNMYVFLIPATFFLFYIAAHIKLKDRKIYGVLRVLGMLLFYLHMFVYYFWSRALEYMMNRGFSGILGNSLFRYSSAVLITLALSFLIYRLSKTQKFRWLKLLYS